MTEFTETELDAGDRPSTWESVRDRWKISSDLLTQLRADCDLLDEQVAIAEERNKEDRKTLDEEESRLRRFRKAKAGLANSRRSQNS